MRQIFVIILTFILLCSSFLVAADKINNNEIIKSNEIVIETYDVDTSDGYSITFTRFVGGITPPIILIHGMGCNHHIFDWDEEHSIARYLANNNFDVWLLDLRTHDGDGDFLFVKDSDQEYIDRYWDFDNTLLKIDVVTGVDFVKTQTGIEKVFLGGHSYGGYLAYAYAMLIGEENLSGIITTGAAPYDDPRLGGKKNNFIDDYGFVMGNKAYVRPFGKPYTERYYHQVIYGSFILRLKHLFNRPTSEDLFYKDTTPYYIQHEVGFHLDNEPAGVYVDMFFGKNPNLYNGHWVDPQTLYDYSENLDKITVPICFVAGDKDPQDPMQRIYQAYLAVSSIEKEFLHYADHSHMDLILGDDADELIFPDVVDWLDSVIDNIE